MGRYKIGRWRPNERAIECDECGFDWHFSSLRKGVSKAQKGLNICPDCFDPIHPNENWKMAPRQEGKLEPVR